MNIIDFAAKNLQTLASFRRLNGPSLASLALGLINPSTKVPAWYVASTGKITPFTGVGGAVTQITSAATGVTLSKLTGQITTVALTTAAAAEEVFTVTNTLVAATDIIVVSTTYAGAGTIQVTTKKVAAGSFDITIANLHASNALNAVVVVNFAVLGNAIA